MRQRVSRLSAGALVLALLLACGDEADKFSPPPNGEGWWRDRVVYQVFVRSFADSDGDGRGDLAGLTANLDYLNDGDPSTDGDLGVEAIWLMPIFASPSYHGYDVTDYRAIEPDYGTLDDFDAFVAAARVRGIRVIVDMVLNHSSVAHPWFVESASAPSSPRRDWYVWSPENEGWRRPWDGTVAWTERNGAWYYGLFSPSMPDLNLANPAVEAELVDTMKFWLARGVDGFRLDAVRYFVESADGALADQPETHAFLKRIRAALQREHPHALLVAEAWANVETTATYYGQGDEVQLAFAFGMAGALTRAPVQTAGDGTGSAAPIVNTLVAMQAAVPDPGYDAPFLSNHDQVRVARVLGGDPGALRALAATLFALPGTPFVYYGEELGMQGGPDSATTDEDKRTPMRWTPTGPGYGFTSGTPWRSTAAEADGTDVATQRATQGSLWRLYRDLIALRAREASLHGGTAEWLAPSGGGPGVLALLRSAAGERTLFVANFATEATGAFTVPAGGSPSVLQSEGLAGAPTTSGALLSVSGLAPRGFAFVSLD